MTLTMLSKAEWYAWKYHAGQRRKIMQLPYVVHPANVVQLLVQHGVTDEATLTIAWLHDTLEDTKLTYQEIHRVFGQNIADGVLALTQQGDRTTYNAQILAAPNNIQMVKLCDTLDNLTTLHCLSPTGIVRKIRECEEMYIPMAQQLCPPLAKKIQSYVQEHISTGSV